MKINFRKQLLHRAKEDRGVALIFVLGVITLLSMLALTFAITSTLNHKSATNLSAQTISQLSLQAGLQRAITSIKIYSNNIDKDFSDTYIFSSNQESGISNNIKRESLGGPNGLMNTVINSVNYYGIASENYDVNNNPTWQYLPFDHGPNNPIIGRFACVVLSDLGKIDPSACIDSGKNAYDHSTSAISEDFPASEATMIDSSGNPVIGRPGRNVNELFLKTLSSSWFTEQDAQKISSGLASPAGELKLASGAWTARWDNLDLLFDKLNIPNDKKNTFSQFFNLNNPADPEAFWIDANGDHIKDKNKLYHRFNLTRTDWNNLTISDILSASNDYTSSQGGGIPWLNNWQSAGEMENSITCKSQIAANLIDYNDLDTSATTDSEDNPTYVGLEKCPYINEVKFNVEGEVQETRNRSLYDYTCSLNLKQISVELANMYDTGNLNTTATVSISGTYRWTPNPDGDNEDVPFEKTVPINIAAASSSYGYTTYDLPSPDISPSNNTNTGISQTERSITDFKITNLTVKLVDQDNANFYDFANIEPYDSGAEPVEDNGYDISGTVLINPNNSGTKEFTMNVPDAPYTINRDTLHAGGSGYTYDGPASYIKLKSHGQLKCLTVNGKSLDIHYNPPTEIASDDMTVEIKNRKAPKGNGQKKVMGQWLITINAKNAVIVPDPNLETETGDTGYSITDDGEVKSRYLDYEIADPRQNLLASDWGGVTASSDTDTGTIGFVNTKFMPNPGGNTDPEPNATEPWEISTAYIRNSAMQSPWELGFLHRGAKWQTINLKNIILTIILAWVVEVTMLMVMQIFLTK